MLFLLSAIAFVVLLTGLILIHEWGHYIAAKKSGVEVEEFGFGLPPRIKTLFRRKGTAFTLNTIPFGGFVRLKGENAVHEEDRHAPGSFAAAPLLNRCLILVAGVGMNFLLAVVLFTIGFSLAGWVPTYLSVEEMRAAADRGEIALELGVLIDGTVVEGPAARAGVGSGFLLAVDGQPVMTSEEVRELQRGKDSVEYRIRGFGEDAPERTVTVAVEEDKTGVVLRTIPRVLEAPNRDLFSAFALSLREAKVVVVQTVVGIVSLVTSLFRTATVPEGITGIVGIAQLTYASVQQGFMVYVRLVALLSLSLAALNILPFPALDGGRLLFVLLEAMYTKPSTRKLEMFVNTIGFAVLLLLILLVTVYDVLRLFA